MKSKNNNESKSEFSYKETLNLLKTEFSMRANSVMREPEIQKFWADNKSFKKSKIEKFIIFHSKQLHKQ